MVLDMTSTLERRLEALKDAYGGDEGCDRCRSTLVIVEDAITGRFHSASWNGEDITEGELHERQTERECPRCGRKLDPEEDIEIQVGGKQR
jgi:hypothetical protein